MNRTTEKIPTWSLAYIINGDATALTDDEVQTIDRWMKRWQVQDVSPLTDEEGNAQPYFTHYPLFGLPTEVEDCEKSPFPRLNRVTKGNSCIVLLAGKKVEIP